MRRFILFIGLSLSLASCGDSDNEYDASGVFEATETIVSAQGTGELLRFDIEEGMELKADSPVGCIDTIQLHLQKLQLAGNLQSAASRRYNVEQQVASIRQQIATQRKEQQRFANLVKDNAANRKQLDDIEAQIALLEKQLSARQETLNNTNSGANGDIQSLQAQIALLNDKIQKCIISSPISGTVLTKYAERGELASPGKALFKVADMRRINLRAYVTADQLTRLKIGQAVRVFADEGRKGRKEYPGTLTWISDKAEFTPKTIQTRDERANLVYAIKIAVENDGYIKRGMYGEIKIDNGQ
ncbi:MAG: HlyD family secretion protein [Bacteroidaceae bacterium]|jgi:HlyD family secretion protein